MLRMSNWRVLRSWHTRVEPSATMSTPCQCNFATAAPATADARDPPPLRSSFICRSPLLARISLRHLLCCTNPRCTAFSNQTSRWRPSTPRSPRQLRVVRASPFPTLRRHRTRHTPYHAPNIADVQPWETIRCSSTRCARGETCERRVSSGRLQHSARHAARTRTCRRSGCYVHYGIRNVRWRDVHSWWSGLYPQIIYTKLSEVVYHAHD